MPYIIALALLILIIGIIFNFIATLYENFPFVMWGLTIGIPTLVIYLSISKSSRHKSTPLETPQSEPIDIAYEDLLEKRSSFEESLKAAMDRNFSNSYRYHAFTRADRQCERTGDNGERCEKFADNGDHYYPWSKGGASHLQNFLASCQKHNFTKSAKILLDGEREAIEDRRRTYFPVGEPVTLGMWNSDIQKEIDKIDLMISQPLGSYSSLPSLTELIEDKRLHKINEYVFLKVSMVLTTIQEEQSRIRDAELQESLQVNLENITQETAQEHEPISDVHADISHRPYNSSGRVWAVSDDGIASKVGEEGNVGTLYTKDARTGFKYVFNSIIAFVIGCLVPLGFVLVVSGNLGGISLIILGLLIGVVIWFSNNFHRELRGLAIALFLLGILSVVAGLIWLIFDLHVGEIITVSGMMLFIVGGAIPGKIEYQPTNSVMGG